MSAGSHVIRGEVTARACCEFLSWTSWGESETWPLVAFFSWFLNQAAPWNTQCQNERELVWSAHTQVLPAVLGSEAGSYQLRGFEGTFPPVLRGTLPLAPWDSHVGRLPQAPAASGDRPSYTTVPWGREAHTVFRVPSGGDLQRVHPGRALAPGPVWGQMGPHWRPMCRVGGGQGRGSPTGPGGGVWPTCALTCWRWHLTPRTRALSTLGPLQISSFSFWFTRPFPLVLLLAVLPGSRWSRLCLALRLCAFCRLVTSLGRACPRLPISQSQQVPPHCSQRPFLTHFSPN